MIRLLRNEQFMIRLLRNEQFKNDMLQRSGKKVNFFAAHIDEIRKIKMKAPIPCSGILNN
jgi:hypothetical protein